MMRNDSQTIKKANKPDRCPITQEICQDPIRLPDDHVYERQAILDHIEKKGTNFISAYTRVQYQLNNKNVLAWAPDRSYLRKRDVWLLQEGYVSQEGTASYAAYIQAMEREENTILTEYVKRQPCPEISTPNHLVPHRDTRERMPLGVYEIQLTAEQLDAVKLTLVGCSSGISDRDNCYNYFFKPVCTPFVFIAGCVFGPCVGMCCVPCDSDISSWKDKFLLSLAFLSGCGGGAYLAAEFLTHDLHKPITFNIEPNQFKQLIYFFESNNGNAQSSVLQNNGFVSRDNNDSEHNVIYVVGKQECADLLFTQGLQLNPHEKSRLICFDTLSYGGARKFCLKMNAKYYNGENSSLVVERNPRFITSVPSATNRNDVTPQARPL